MRILFIVPYVPNLIRVRSYNLIRHLSQAGHQVTVLTLWTDRQDLSDVEHLAHYCRRVHAVHQPRWRSWMNCLAALPSRVPLQAVYAWTPDLASQIAELTAEADIVHVEHLRGAHYALHVQDVRGATAPPVVWDSVDCISYLFEQAAQGSQSPFGRWVSRFELPRTRRYEGWLAGQFDRVLVTSAKDRGALVQLREAYAGKGPGRPDRASRLRTPPPGIDILPNGVDVDYFAPVAETREPETIVFSGKMSYHANITAVLYLINRVMPSVWSQRKDVRVIVVGKDPPPQILSLASENGSRVQVTGTVPDIRPYLHKATVAVVPLVYGAGSQFKVLEAMACETPVVATERAVSAFDVNAGTDVMVESEPDAFARAILQLLEDPQLRRSMGAAGRRYVERHHDWSRIVSSLQEIYDEVIDA